MFLRDLGISAFPSPSSPLHDVITINREPNLMAQLNDHLLVLDRPALLVGITGTMNLEPADEDSLRDRVRLVLRFLCDGESTELADALAEHLAPRDTDRRLHNFYRGLLRRWQPLDKKSIVVLSALAPGADSIVADEALKLGLRVAAPLPFPQQQYRDCSTFVRKDPPTAEDEARQKVFDELCRRIGVENCFHVPLAEDQARSVEERLNQTQHDLKAKDEADRPRRYARYYAAGEYLTSYCHLLLAAWDGRQEKSGEGASAVVQARLAGPRPGILSTTSDLAQPHGGPLLHLFARKAGKPAGEPQEIPSLRLLHPYSYESTEPPEYQTGDVIAPHQHTHRGLQRERLGTFFRLARDLESFNRLELPQWAQRDRDHEFKARLKQVDPSDSQDKGIALPDSHPLHATELLGGLRRVSDLRSAAADGTAWFNARSLATLRWLFVLTLLAAVMLHVFSHWHPREKIEDHASQHAAASHAVVVHDATDQDELTDDHTEGEHAGHVFSPFRVFAGAAAFVLAFAAMILFVLARSWRFQEQDADARALSEGLRVQFYWNLAGLGRSVSANYMQRQRSELDWIRGAIRTVSMPYYWWSDQFRQLPPDQQIAALRCVEGGWIREQLTYFKDAYDKRHHSLHRWHKLGFVLSLAGLFSLLSWWGGYWLDEDSWLMIKDRYQFRRGALVLLAVAAVWRLIVWCCVLRRKYIEREDEKRPSREENKPEEEKKDDRPMWRRVLEYFFPKRKLKGPNASQRELEPRVSYILGRLAAARRRVMSVTLKAVDVLVPALEPASHSAVGGFVERYVRSLCSLRRPGSKSASDPAARGFIEQLARSVYNFGALLPLSLAMAWLTVFTVLAAEDRFPDWPNAENLGIIAGGVLLLCGALSIAWAEKNLDSELGYQYNTMAGLFAHAAQRMARELNHLDQLQAKISTAAPDSSEHQTAQIEFAAAVRQTQDFLYALGIEALDENAEWLILHRARPLEPVMAG